VKIVHLIIGLFFLPFLLLASENENNLTWIENNLNSIFDSLKIADHSTLENTELDFGKVNGDKFGFIKNQIIKYYDSEDINNHAKKDSVLFRIEQFDIEIVYEQSSAGFLNLETKTVRKNTINLAGWIENKSNNSVIKSLNIYKTFSEKLTTNNISQLEESPYSFTKGETNELSLWVNIIEPAMVISSVAVVVYLFFSVRS